MRDRVVYDSVFGRLVGRGERRKKMGEVEEFVVKSFFLSMFNSVVLRLFFSSVYVFVGFVGFGFVSVNERSNGGVGKCSCGSGR